jgi:hypothetical protein
MADTQGLYKLAVRQGTKNDETISI